MRIEGNNVFLDNNTTVEQALTITAVIENIFIAANPESEVVAAIPNHITAVSIIDNATAVAVRAIPEHVRLVYIAAGVHPDAVRAIPSHVQTVNISEQTDIAAITAIPDSVLHITFSGLPNRLIEAINNHVIRLDLINRALNVAHLHEAYTRMYSLAYWLARIPEGLVLLTANNNALGSQINTQTLNTIHTRQSVALFLACTPEGRAILAANNNALSSQINAQNLNSVIADGPYAGVTIAHILTIHEIGMLADNGCQANLLTLRNNEVVRLTTNAPIKKMPRDLIRMLPAMLLRPSLGSKVTAHTLNAGIEFGRYVGNCLAFWLAGTPEGRVILAANNNALGSQITEENLNAVIPNGPNAGLTVKCLLERHPVGREILAANSSRLGLRHGV